MESRNVAQNPNNTFLQEASVQYYFTGLLAACLLLILSAWNCISVKASSFWCSELTNRISNYMPLARYRTIDLITNLLTAVQLFYQCCSTFRIPIMKYSLSISYSLTYVLNCQLTNFSLPQNILRWKAFLSPSNSYKVVFLANFRRSPPQKHVSFRREKETEACLTWFALQ